MKKLSTLLLMAALCAAVSLPALTHGQGSSQRPNSPEANSPSAESDEARFAPNELLILFRSGVSEVEKANARSRVGAARLERIETQAMRDAGYGNLERASIPPGLAIADAVGRLQNHPAVLFAEPNWVVRHQAASNDPYYTNGSLWGMYGNQTSPANQYGSQAGEAWASGYTGSNNVYIGVIDEGIDHRHNDLSANIWNNPNEIAGNGVDDDGNGYIDDVQGWDFFHDDNSIYDGGDADGCADTHGTHVAGTIGGIGGNGTGVAGVNWSVTLISGKFLGPSGGYTSDAIQAVDYFTALRNRGLNIVATNNSWGGGGYSQALHDAVIRGAKAGILFIAAAGNDKKNNDKNANYPSNYDTTVGTSTEAAASYDAVIAVMGLASGGGLYFWTNFGARTVDLGAPGAGINSTLPNNSYGSMSGTSMATPHVSGAVALYQSAHAATAAQTRSAILSTVTYTSSLNGKCATNGRLNIGCLMNGVCP